MSTPWLLAGLLFSPLISMRPGGSHTNTAEYSYCYREVFRSLKSIRYRFAVRNEHLARKPNSATRI